jgi:preprotein translocase SecE subunit
VSAQEESKLVTSAELDNREEQMAHDGANKGMEKTTESTSTSAPSGAPPPSINKASQKKGSLIQFLKEVIIEFKKITWPGSKEVIQATWSVLALVAIITSLVLAFDWVFANGFFGPLEHFARLHGGGVGAPH